MPQKPLLSVVDLTVSFPAAQNFEAVKEVSFSIEEGKTLAIVGESGSGKSLIALTMMGLQPKESLIKGQINLVNDNELVPLHQLNQKEWQAYRGNLFGMIFQEPMSALNPVQCVGRQIQECILQHQQLSKKQAKAKTIEWIGKVKLPNPERLYYRFPHQLSGGQKQRIMIAMAMCNQPKILLADEPTTALDATVQQEIILLMKDLQTETGTSMIFISHDLALTAEIADDIMVMHKGTCIEYGNAKEILTAPKADYTKALLSCRPNINNKGKKLPVIADYMAGEFSQENLPIPLVSENLILNVENLHVWYPEGKNFFGKTSLFFKAVNGVSFDMYKGMTIGLVGESGCGKSTIGKSLMGLAPIKSGKITLNNKRIEGNKGNQWNEVRRLMQLVFQDPFASLNPRRTVADIITEPFLIHHLNKGKNLQKEAERLLDLVQLPKNAGQRYPHQFSGGQRQRIGIARALAVQPQILICDESVSALDVSVQAQILNLLKELQYELGLSYLFISHDLSVVHYMADKILVMQKGEITEQGTADEILLHPKTGYTKKLITAMPSLEKNPPKI
ncbi:MAG: ABC transporter ATP-binding protein [Bacteroidota bacterium]